MQFINVRSSLLGVLLILNLSKCIDGLTKKNRLTDMITDERNYFIDDSCNGIKFPNNLNGIMALDKMINNIEEIILSDYGRLIMEDGASIEFNRNNVKRCMVMKERIPMNWVDINAWEFKGDNNTSIPDVERIPCNHDEVNLTDNYNVRLPLAIQLFTGRDVTLNDIAHAEAKKLLISGEDCENKMGCVCHEYLQSLEEEICENVNEKELHCMIPIKPIGFCRMICGGYIHMNVNDGFDIKEFNNKLPKYKYTNVYASKVQLNNTNVIQVVFTDKNDDYYEAYSADDAEEFKKNFLKDLTSMSINSILTIKTSGLPYYPANSAKNFFTIVLITMIINIVIFIGIFYYHQTEQTKFRFNLPRRFNIFGINGFAQNIPRSFTFARFQNRDDNDYGSISGSVINLDQSFDNPLYNQTSTSNIEEEPSTSGTNQQREHEEETLISNTELEVLNKEVKEKDIVVHDDDEVQNEE